MRSSQCPECGFFATSHVFINGPCYVCESGAPVREYPYNPPVKTVLPENNMSGFDEKCTLL